MDPSASLFSPQRCADLHNRLLAKAIEHNPEARTEQTLATRFLQAAPEFAELPSIEEIPLYQFLELIDNTPVDRHGRIDLLSPSIYQPDPTRFFHERAEDMPARILLYGQNLDSSLDGGIWLDIQSYRAVWYEVDFPCPPADEWLPLDVLLQKELDAWGTGKYYFNSEIASIDTRPWTQHDLEQSIAAWGRLLSSIESRMPTAEKSDIQTGLHKRLEPLSPETLAPFKLSVFATRFLTTAPRPNFTFVAPGTRVFTPSLAANIYGSEAPNSSRQVHWIGQEEDWPTLILPGVEPAPHNVSHDTNRDISCFDKDWGFGKFTVNRQSGLYIMLDFGNHDLVKYVASSGLCDGGQFRFPCRWCIYRTPKLAELFDHWTTLVEDGTWDVDENGVCTDHSWFTSDSSKAKVPPLIGLD
ncbi:hypothetical protein F5Y01DRAFT_17063 [Xylaria sp. FL0043]|nr:hypothetical protein F5Y01DRAFT_17063 [Xylaria sp. FL0043]